MYKKIRNFSVGQEVYTEKNIRFGWNQLYKHGIFERHTIKSISPKGRSLTLDDGTKVTVNSYGQTDIALYEYDPEMEKDTEKAMMFARFMKTKADFNELYNRSNFVGMVAGMSADKVPELTRLFQEIVDLLKDDEKMIEDWEATKMD